MDYQKINQIPKEYLDLLGISFCRDCGGVLFSPEGIMSANLCLCSSKLVTGCVACVTTQVDFK